MDPRLLELAIQAMTPAAFEDLVFALVRAEEPTARQLNPPDAGRDTIVPATDEQRERAWQAKHHVSGIAWRKCEESLKRALEERDPETVTFVFPVNMTEGKEEGLEDLRRRYPEVDLPEPWTLGTLREKLADAPDIRRHHIDRRQNPSHQEIPSARSSEQSRPNPSIPHRPAPVRRGLAEAPEATAVPSRRAAAAGSSANSESAGHLGGHDGF